VEQKALDQAADKVYKKLEAAGGDPLKLPVVQQPIALLYTFQAMVDNGGFQYPMETNFPFDPPYSAFSAAYRQIGATNAAESLDKAIALFPFSNPHLDSQKRLEFFASIPEDHEFYVLSDLVCGDETVWTLMEQYVLDHPESFQKTPENIN
jgi:hypothetical protein